MGYRGGDLELRTPQGLPATSRPARTDSGVLNGWQTRTVPEERATPIWVDDTVMECCNQAFELASAHRAGEVRLDHLLHALTVVDASVKVLEQQGIRAPALRRDTGARIAADTPLPAGANAPRRSHELQETLERASERAYARRRPVSVSDLISILLQAPRDWPGIDLVLEHTSDWSLREAPEPRERVRVAAVSQQTMATRSEAVMPDFLADGGWSNQQARPDTTVPAPGVMPAEVAQILSQLSERLHSVEQMASRLQAVDQIATRLQSVDHLANRMQVIDQVAVKFQSIEKLDSRIDELQKAFSGIAERLSGMESHLQDGSSAQAGTLTAIVDRIGAVEGVIGKVNSGDALAAFDARLAGIEKQTSETTLLLQVADEQLSALASRITSPNANDDGLRNEISAISGTIDRQRTDILSAVSQSVRDGITTLDLKLDTQGEIGARLLQTETAVTRLDGRVAESGQSLIRELNQFHENLVKINVNQQTIAAGMDQWRSDTTADLTVLNDRLEDVERASTQVAQAQEAMQSSVQALHAWTTRWQTRRARWRQQLLGGIETRLANWRQRDVEPVEADAATEAVKPAKIQGEPRKPDLTRRWMRPRTPQWLDGQLAKLRRKSPMQDASKIDKAPEAKAG